MTYVIRRTRHFFGPKAERSLVASENGEALEFSTRLDAAAWVDQREAEIYHESHNESGRPEYKIIRADKLPAYLR